MTEEAFYLSPLQQAAYTARQAVGRSAFAVRLQGPLDADALHQAVAALHQAQEILDTGYVRMAGVSQPLQQVMEVDLTWDTHTAPLDQLDSLLDQPESDHFAYRLIRHDAQDHSLIVTAPALSLDGASPAVFVRALAQALQGDELPETMQYIDYAEWREQIKEENETLTPTRRQPDLPEHILDADAPFLTHTLPETAISPQLALALWRYQLGLVLDADPLTIDVIADGRIYDELEPAIGVIDPIVPVDIPAAASLTEAVAAAETALTDAQERSLRWFAEATDEGGRYGFEQRPRHEATVGQLTLSLGPAHIHRHAHQLHLIHQENGLSIQSQGVNPVFAQRLADGLAMLIHSAQAQPEATLAALPMIGADERHTLVQDFNDNRIPLAPRCIHTAIEEQVARTPDALAVVHRDQRYTFDQLNRRANRLAHWLIQEGVRLETKVAFSLERDADVIVLILAILKAGGTYVSLETGEPAARLAGMLEDTGAPLCFYRDIHDGELIKSAGDAIRFVDPDHLDLGAQPDTNPDIAVSPENLAYTIYTSGSTGKPKGVAVAHAKPLNLLAGIKTLVYSGLAETGLAVGLNAPFSFDASMQQISTLTLGHHLVIVPQDVRLDAHAFVAFLDENPLDALDGTPTHLTTLVDAGLLRIPNRPHRFLAAGSAVDQHLWDQLAADDRLRAFNIYGPTEATVDATGAPITQVGHAPVIGGPLANYQIYLTNTAAQLTPWGVPGEILIGGDGLARGYHGRPGLTAERFIPDPFGDQPGARLYRTGDLAKHHDGGVLFIGRIDTQVKIRGFRIELGEIEQILTDHTAVSQAVVAAHPVDPGSNDLRLVAYVTGVEGASVDEHELRRYAREHLPEHMTPAFYVTLDRMPLKPNGKVDRKALPVPDFHHVTDGGTIDPDAPLEALLAGAWESVLETEGVGPEHDFFELGGHSLLATQLVSRIRELTSVEFTLQDLFSGATVNAAAERIRQLQQEQGGLSLPPLTRAERDDTAPLSFAQQRLWTLQTTEPDSNAYNIPFALEADGDLDDAALERALHTLIQRHESLRTTFHLSDEGQPEQRIGDGSNFQLERHDLTDLDEVKLETRIDELAHQHATAPFDITQGPLVRAALIKRSDRRHLLLFNKHHIITDAWSITLLIREMGVLYHAYRNNQTPDLPELDRHYADYAIWQRTWLKDDALDQQLGYWRDKLAGVAALQNLPAARTDVDRLSQRDVQIQTDVFQLPEDLSASLHEVSRTHGVTLFMTLTAAYKLLMWYHTGDEDLVIGTDVANRNHLRTEHIIGFFINQLVLRDDFSGDPTLAETLGRVRKTTLDAYMAQDTPFEKIVEAVNPKRHAGVTPIFQTKFVLQNAPAGRLELDDLTFEQRRTAEQAAQIDLQINMWEAGAQMAGSVTFALDLYHPATVQTLIRQFTHILAKITAEPELNLSELRTSLEEEDRRQRGRAANRAKKSAFAKFKR